MACSRFSDSRDDAQVYAKKGAAAEGKGMGVSSRFIFVIAFLNFANPTISEPGTG